MRPRIRAAALAGAAALGLALPGVGQAADAGVRACSGQGRTYLASDHLRLVAGTPVDDTRYGFYACNRGSRRGVHLFDQDFTPQPTQLAGRFVVDETISCERRQPYACSGETSVYDGRTRRFRRSPIEPNVGLSIRGASSLLVTQRGVAAWTRDARETPGFDVWVWMPGTPPRIVATGTSINPRSLAAAAGRLYWTDGGQPRTLALG